MVVPHRSIMWTALEWADFLQTRGVNSKHMGVGGEIRTISNFKSVAVFNVLSVSDKDISVPCVEHMVLEVVVPEVQRTGGEQFPTSYEQRYSWVQKQLLNSTRGGSHDISSTAATRQLMNWLDEMVPGKESTHLHALYKHIGLRGADVRLDLGCVLTAGRQSMPYPAFAWEWSVVQSYPWAVQQHIHVLELIAFFDYLRGVINRTSFSSVRFFHILDSMVASSVVAKGRSSSRILNRTLRRIVGLCLAGDIYPLPLWTVSGWNYSDAGSRYIRSPLEYAASA